MKSAYVICVLLGVMIGTLVLADNGAVLKMNETHMLIPSPATESANNIADLKSAAHETTTPMPSTANNTSTNETTVTQSTTTPKATTTPINTTTTTTTTTTNITTTTVAPTTSAIPNNTTITTQTTPTTVSPTTVTPSKTTSYVSTSPAAAKTTATPPAPSKDRQFDGLSFFGGIILTTCLMAIAAFSWRFYKQCKEGNYRTL